MNYKTEYQMVRDFHSAFSYQYNNNPTIMNTETVLNRMSFLAEEMIEMLHSSSRSIEEFKDLCEKLIDRMAESYDKQVQKPFPKDNEERLIAQVDAATDIRYFNTGDFTILGIDPLPPFQIIHQANMAKLIDGKPQYNEHGKIIKPDDWVAPDELLREEIERQINNSEQ